MTPRSGKRWLWLTALAILAATAASYWGLRADAISPFWLRVLAEDFVGPGTTVWWLTLGGPYQVNPESPGHVAWAIAANTIFWLLVAALLRAIIRLVRRLVSAPRA
jgi:hypothetical protein